jgi:hypothetical protein
MKCSFLLTSGGDIVLEMTSLDDERFSEIAERARKLIISYAPEWTDHNPHDPGITLLELFAWMKEMQQYELDQITSASRLKFLKLLGMERRKKQPAKVLLRCFGALEPCVLPIGTCVLAGDVPFETTQRLALTGGSIIDAFFQRGDKRIGLVTEIAYGKRGLQYHIFGKNPAAGDAFYIGFDRQLPQGVPLVLEFELFSDYPVKRNPFGGDFLPLAELRWEYYTAEGWRRAEQVEDATHALLDSGLVTITVGRPMAEQSLTREGYWLRVVLESCNYDVPPLLTGLSLGIVPALQQQTMCRYQDFQPANKVRLDETSMSAFQLQAFVRVGDYWVQQTDAVIDRNEELMRLEVTLPQGDQAEEIRIVGIAPGFLDFQQPGTGDGFPHQKFVLETSDLMEGGFALMVEGQSGYEDWYRVADFDASKPTDRHYTFDEETGIIAFGDCERGLAPEGAIRIISCLKTLGREGNVKAGSVNRYKNGALPLQVINEHNASGGIDGETIDQAFSRFLAESQRVRRAVTYEDYETLARTAPGLMVQSCKVIPVGQTRQQDGSLFENRVTIVVQPFSLEPSPQLSERYVDNLLRHFNSRQLIGTSVSILSPEYIGITIYAQLLIRQYFRNAEVEVRQALSRYFSEETCSFGQAIRHSTIYGLLDSIRCVSAVQTLVLDAQGRGLTRNASGDVLLPNNGLAYLKNLELTLLTAD